MRFSMPHRGEQAVAPLFEGIHTANLLHIKPQAMQLLRLK
jgi:hypothetical protein